MTYWFYTGQYSCILIEWQFDVTHTIHQTEIPTLLDSCVKNTPFVKMMCPQKTVCPYIFEIT
jgi:hypothetical protein